MMGKLVQGTFGFPAASEAQGVLHEVMAFTCPLRSYTFQSPQLCVFSTPPMPVSSPTMLWYSTQAPIANECMMKSMSTQWKLPNLPMSPLLLLNPAQHHIRWELCFLLK